MAGGHAEYSLQPEPRNRQIRSSRNEDYEASRKMLAVRVVSCPELSDCIRTLPQRLVGWEAGLAFWRSHDGKPFPSTRVFLESEGRAMARTAAVEECLAALAQGELPGEAKPWF